MIKVPTIFAIVAIALFNVVPNSSAEDRPIFNFTIYLDGLGEPDIRESCETKIDRFRLIVLPTFSDAWSIRMDKAGKYVTVFMAKTAGRTPAERSSAGLDSANWERLNEILIDTDFLNLTVTSQSMIWMPDDDMATFEQCRGGKYYLVQRQGSDEETGKLIEFFYSMKYPK